MFGKLLPKNVNFFNFFDQHAFLIVKAAEEIKLMISSPTDNMSKANYVKELEHQADLVTHQCVECLHKVFITPIERDDIFRLVSRMDDILDDIEATAECLSRYKLQEMTNEVKDLADILYRSVLEVEIAVKGLRNLNSTTSIRQSCLNINRLENEADAVLRNSIVNLFDTQPDTRLIIKWKEIYENLEKATDRCEDVANIIEGVILELA